MTLSNKDLINILSDLRETNIDLRKTYETAAENVDDTTLRNKFTQLSEQNQRFATELENEISNLGERPKSDGSFVGTLHRGFMDIRSAFSKNDVPAMIDECIRAEKMAIDNYEDALNNDFPANVQTLVSRQYGALKSVREDLKNLKTSY
ncbi:MAG: ferritin-like domain-containing protein [Bradymonadaceae bacterium]